MEDFKKLESPLYYETLENPIWVGDERIKCSSVDVFVFRIGQYSSVNRNLNLRESYFVPENPRLNYYPFDLGENSIGFNKKLNNYKVLGYFTDQENHSDIKLYIDYENELSLFINNFNNISIAFPDYPLAMITRLTKLPSHYFRLYYDLEENIFASLNEHNLIITKQEQTLVSGNNPNDILPYYKCFTKGDKNFQNIEEEKENLNKILGNLNTCVKIKLLKFIFSENELLDLKIHNDKWHWILH